MTAPIVTINRLEADPVSSRRTEFVERKGLGHPETICDGIAESISRRRSEYYREEFDRVLHHDTDTVQLVAGSAKPAFGGGSVEDPIHVLLGGRATKAVDGHRVPVDELTTEAARAYVTDTFDHLNPGTAEFDARIGKASPDRRTLFDAKGVARANDWSVGVGYAPLSETDRIVKGLEPSIRTLRPPWARISW